MHITSRLIQVKPRQIDDSHFIKKPDIEFHLISKVMIQQLLDTRKTDILHDWCDTVNNLSDEPYSES